MNPKTIIAPVHMFAPAAVGTGGVTGDAIVRPWERARALCALISSAAMGASDAFTIKWQARRVGTSTWDDIQDNTGAADLAVPIAVASDGGAMEGGVILASLDLQRLTHGVAGEAGVHLDETYEHDAVRINIVNANNSSPPIIACLGFLTDSQIEPIVGIDGSETTDHTYFLQNGLDG